LSRASALVTQKTAPAGRLQFVQTLAPFSALGHLVNAGFAVAYLWGEQPRGLLLAWFAWVGLVSGMIMMLARRGADRTPKALSARAMRRAVFFTAFSALPWGALGAYVSLAVSNDRQAIISVVLIGMATGGCLIMAALPRCAIAFVATALAPILVARLSIGTMESVTFSFCILTYVMLITSFSLAHTEVMAKQERAQDEMRDSLDQLREANQAIERLARQDAVTGLMNRVGLQEAMAQVFAEPPPPETLRPLFLIDLDHFKAVNDARGHGVGDAYLRVIGGRLREAAPPDALVARLGGDEFAVALTNPVSEAQMLDVGAAILDRLSRNVRVEGWEMKAGCSVGLAMAPTHSNCPTELMSFADDALLGAKEAGRGGLKIFDLGRREHFLQRAADAALLMLAVARREIEVVYQPQIALDHGGLVGFEALARWRHPSRGPMPPPEFFQIAEDNGMILDLSGAILDRLRRDLETWTKAGLDFGRIAVNLHPAQLSHPIELDEQLERLRDVVGVQRLTLEVTENCVMGRGTEEIPALLRRLSAQGYGISLDDFGTGFASLSHLTELPIDETKIDRKFVSATPDGSPDMTIVRAICDMARPRGIRVVAEGVETEAQRAALAELPNVEGQGWLFSRPLPAAEVPNFIANAMSRAA
jgi:diguanylate cyclase (GGDEF)-like protein